MPRKSEKHDVTFFTVSSSASRKRYVSAQLLSDSGTDQISATNVSTRALAASQTIPINEVLQEFSSQKEQLSVQNSQLSPELFNLQTLLEQPQTEPDWVIPGLLPVGVSLFAGPSRIDKPLLANQLGLSVATGTPFLDLFPVHQGQVVYLALAENRQQIRGRAVRLLNGQGGPTNFTVALKWAPFRESGLADLEDLLTTLSETRLIIVDPLELVLPLQPNQGYRARQHSQPVREPGFFLPLRELATRYSLSILLLHHLSEEWSANRSDPLAGLTPTGLTPASACNLLLTSTGRPHESLLHIAGSQIAERHLMLTCDPQQGRWCAA
ncbi:MAG TPA: AAA family ATPase [Ktedonobacteraceae bacterium]|nr:AAA family ATPase [Ktedonobacteraceae bacterium]